MMYKFRTMVVDADKMVDQLRDLNEHDGNGELFKIKDDPRVTRVGRFLRKWSLDELPQILNVCKGEMSWVGPRPPLPREVEKYESEHYARLKGLPGITGLWQVSGRSDLSFEEMVKLDRFYLDNWSVRLDLSIMMRTVVAVLTRNGAY
jgi:lipopolysaccharide/colanic/teichoic acid biosynthesis glycosyltransferase